VTATNPGPDVPPGTVSENADDAAPPQTAKKPEDTSAASGRQDDVETAETTAGAATTNAEVATPPSDGAVEEHTEPDKTARSTESGDPSGNAGEASSATSPRATSRAGRRPDAPESRLPNSETPRQHPRLQLEAFVDYTGSEVLLYHAVQNISLGGVCIQTDAVEAVGTVVDLVINFPELDAAFAVEGEVVWSNDDSPRDMGIRFVSLDLERKETLRRYIAQIEAKKLSPNSNKRH